MALWIGRGVGMGEQHEQGMGKGRRGSREDAGRRQPLPDAFINVSLSGNATDKHTLTRTDLLTPKHTHTHTHT